MKMIVPGNRPILVLTLLPVFLAACGGGGGDDNDTNHTSHQPADPPRPVITRVPATITQITPEEFAKEMFESRKFGVRRIEPVNSDREPVYSELYLNNVRVQDISRFYVTHDYRSLPQGLVTLPGRVAFPGTDKSFEVTARSYQGFYSGVLVAYLNENDKLANSDVYGEITKAAQMPGAGKATYQGIAFDRRDNGKLVYNVDFGSRRGEGRIEGISRYGTIALNPATIQSTNLGMAINGNASAARGQPLQYSAMFYGAAAEELTGRVHNNAESDGIGFSGTRGEIVQ